MGDRRVENSRSHAVFLCLRWRGSGAGHAPVIAVRTSNRISPPTGTSLRPLSLKPNKSVELSDPQAGNYGREQSPVPCRSISDISGFST